MQRNFRAMSAREEVYTAGCGVTGWQRSINRSKKSRTQTELIVPEDSGEFETSAAIMRR